MAGPRKHDDSARDGAGWAREDDIWAAGCRCGSVSLSSSTTRWSRSFSSPPASPLPSPSSVTLPNPPPRMDHGEAEIAQNTGE
eukprot:2134558-Rhodomonas_salina.2